MTTSLHVGNVANVAYGFAKILNAHASPASVICHDIKHLMSQPEWDDLPLDPADFPDEWDFSKNTADFGAWRRPAWFTSETIVDPFAEVGPLHARVRGWFGRRMSADTKRRIEPAYHRARRAQVRLRQLLSSPAVTTAPGSAAAAASASAVMTAHAAPDDTDAETRLREMVARSAALGREWAMDAGALRRYLPHAAWLARHAAAHDVVFTYVLSPIYGMLYGRKPQVSVEIGTMRDLAFGTSVTASLLWPAYRFSDHVVVTNPDNRDLADAAGIESYSFCPHPLDDRMFAPGEEPDLRRELLARYRVRALLFAPARQNWRIKGNDKLIRAFARLRQSGIDAALLAPAWGQEVARSQTLARELGVSDYVAWLPPMPEPLLARHYRAVDLVCDQFQLGVFGLITPKAMACGAPVLTSYEPRHHAWCFAEDPPLAPCSSEDDIVAAAAALLSDEHRRRTLGASARRWIDAHHSPRVVVRALTEAMAIASERFARKRRDRLSGPDRS
jgi:glycosyltransferase involved in cell wall biosynthesis